jgi:hypothetical protein
MPPLTFGRFLTAQWLPAIEHTVRPSTFTSYRAHITNHIGPRLSGITIDFLDATTLNSLNAELLTGGRVKGSGGLSPSTVQRIHSTVHRALARRGAVGHRRRQCRGPQ